MKFTGNFSGSRVAPWFGLGLLLALTSVHAQITVVSSNATSNQFLATAAYNQDFNTLRSSGTGAWINNSTLTGWYASYQNSSNLNLVTSGASAGDLASYGSGTERALGACPGGKNDIYLAFRLVNGTTNTLTGLTLGYDLEKTGSGSITTTLAYQIFSAGTGSVISGTWTTVTSVTAGGTAFSQSLANLPLAAGQEIWIRWQFTRTSGNATVMAIDNLAVSSLLWASNSQAPTIQQQPTSLVTEDGGAVTFSVQASGTPPPSFQWRFNGSDLSGATNSSLVLDPVSPSNAGSYDVVVSNSSGSVTSTAATLSIRGASPSFIPAGGTFTNIATVTLISSTVGSSVRYTTDGTTPTSTTGTLYTGPFTLDQSAVVQAVAVGIGLTDSSVATASFEILQSPVVVTQPSSLTVLEGATASFSVSAAANPAPAYQWRLGGAVVPGATNPLLMVQPATAASSGAYDVVISNRIGMVVTESAILTVQARAPGLSPAPGTYTNSVTVTLEPVTTGTTIRYTLDGSTPSSTQGELYAGPLNLAATTTIRTVATRSDLLDSTVTSGLFTVVVPPPFSGGIHLTATADPANPRAVAVSNSYVQNFSALATSGTGLAWNDDLASNPTVVGWSANAINYGFSTNTTTRGLYSSGSPTDPWLGGVPTGGGGPIHAGLRLVNRSGSSVQSFQLSFDARRVTNAGSNSIVVLSKKFPVGEGSLTNLPATNGNATTILSDLKGWTEVWRTNGLTADINNLTVGLSSLGLASGEELWLGWMLVKAGGNSTLIGIDNVRLEGFAAGVSPIPSSPVASLAGGTYTGTQTISLSSITAGTVIRYTLDGSTPEVSSGTAYSGPLTLSTSGTLKAIAHLSDGTASAVSTQIYIIQSIVPTAPFFNSGPVSQTVTEGASVTLTGSASGHPAPTYQWSRHGTPLTGRTNASLAFSALQGSESGLYELMASNTEGTAFTSATLTVLAAPPVFTPNGGTFFGTQNVTITCATSNALIRYSTNGSDPSPTLGILYSNAVSLGQTTTLKAIAYRADLSASTIPTAVFTRLTNSLNPADYRTQRFSGVTTNSGIPFHTTNNYKGVTANLYVDIYRPSGDTATNRPVVMLIHGGGFRTSGVRTQSYIVTFANELARRGFVAMSIDYRQRSGTDMPTSADELPALKDAAADAHTALKWIRDPARATTYGYDPNLIFIAGGSAGGRITTTLACRETGDMGGLPTTDPYSTTVPPSSATSDANAVYDRTGCVAAAVLWGGPELEYRCYTVNAGDLPCTIIHGSYDVTLQTEGSPDLYQKLLEAGVSAELHLVNGYDHSLGITTSASADAKPQAAVWMAEFFVQEWQRKLDRSRLADPVGTVIRTEGQGLSLVAPFASSYNPIVSWKKDGVVLAGRSGTSLLLTSVEVADAGRYQAVISTPLGSWSSSNISSVDFSNTSLGGITYDSGANSYTHPIEMVVNVADVSVIPLIPVPTFVGEFGGVSATSDDDGDGVPALVEYGLGGSATTSDSDKLPQAAVLGESFAMTVVERVNDPSLQIFPETSAEVSFLILGSTPTRSVSTDQGGVPPGFARVTYSVPIDGKSKQFLRLRFQSSP